MSCNKVFIIIIITLYYFLNYSLSKANKILFHCYFEKRDNIRINKYLYLFNNI